MFKFAEWLLSEEKAQRQIMYHGTTTRNLKSIMSQGLEPFPKNKVWHANSDTGSFENPSRASVGGVYVTTNLLTATSSSFKAGGKDHQLLVVMEIHPHSTVADEDDFVRISKVKIPGLLTTDYSLANVYMPYFLMKNPQLQDKERKRNDQEYVQSVKDHFVEESIKTLKYSIAEEMHPELEKRLRELLNGEGFEAALQRQAAHIHPESFRRYCWNFGNWESGCPFEPPDKKESEQRWSRFMDQITKTYKKIGFPGKKNSSMQTARLLKPVRFTGKDRIICLIEILPYSRDVENWENSHTPVRILYGKPPQKLLDDWQKHEGKWVVVP